MKYLANCPACASPVAKLKVVRHFRSYSGGNALDTQFNECSCGHVFTNPQPSWDELAPFYGREYHVFADMQLDVAALDRLIARCSVQILSHI